MPGAQAASRVSSRHNEILRSPTHTAASKGDLADQWQSEISPGSFQPQAILIQSPRDSFPLVLQLSAPSLSGWPDADISEKNLWTGARPCPHVDVTRCTH